MKTVLSVVLFLFSCQLFSQSAITITSNTKDIRFFLVVGGQQMNDFFETYVQVQNLPAGYHEIKVVFEGDSVADYFKNVMVRNAQEKVFLVEEKKNLKKSVNKSGREIGKVAKIGDHDESFDYLKDIYELDLISKESFIATGAELSVSTEKSISTSVMPAEKEKH